MSTNQVLQNDMTGKRIGNFCSNNFLCSYRFEWLIFIDTLATIAFILSLLSVVAINITLMHFFVRQKVIVIMIAFIVETVSG